MNAHARSTSLQDATDNPPVSKKFSPLPTEWIEALFKRMEAVYLNRFAVTWQGVDIKSAKAVWCESLGKYQRRELAHGASLLTTRDWPPNLAEFEMMCRPPLDFENAYHEAVTQMRRREDGCDTWTNTAVYWAAVKFGQFDLRTLTYTQAAKRWSRCLIEATEAEPVPVPEKLLALPSVGRTTVTQEENRRRMVEVRKTISSLTRSL